MAPSAYYGSVRPARQSSQWSQVKLLDQLWVQLGLLVLGCVFAFWLNLGGYPLFDVDEPRYAQAAYEMLERGDWVTPYFNGVVRFDKPVFFYWLIAIAYKWFGVSEFAARSVSALSATLMVFTVFGLGAKVVGRRFGFLAGMVLVSSVMMAGIGRMSITDMNLALWMTLTTAVLYLVPHHNRAWWLAAGVFAGIGILTKGPVAIVLPGAVLVIYSLLTQQFKKSFLTPWFLVAVLVALILPLPWYFAAYDANGQVFLDALYNHNVSRFSGAVNYHIKPFWYYVPVLLVGFMPWVVFLPAAIRTAWRYGQFQMTLRERSPLVSMLLYSAVWAVTVFVFFSVAKTKLLTYILPMFPGLALFVGGAAYILTLTDDHRIAGMIDGERPVWQMSGGVFVLLQIIAMVVVLFIMDSVVPPEAIHLVANPLLYGFVVLLMLGTAAAMGLLANQRPLMGFSTLSLTVAVVAGLIWCGFVPQVNQLTQGDMMDFVALAGDAPKEGRLAIYEITRPSLTFYTHKPITHIARQDAQAMANYVALSGPETPAYLITKNKLSDDLVQHLPEGAEPQVVKKGQVYSMFAVYTQTAPQPEVNDSDVEESEAVALEDGTLQPLHQAEQTLEPVQKGEPSSYNVNQHGTRPERSVSAPVSPKNTVSPSVRSAEQSANGEALVKTSRQAPESFTQPVATKSTVTKPVSQTQPKTPVAKHKLVTPVLIDAKGNATPVLPVVPEQPE